MDRSGPISTTGPGPVAGVAFAALVVVLAVYGTALLNDGDTLWHLATGEWIVQEGRLPRVDPFSYTRGGEPWIAKEWLSQLLLLGAFRAGGWPGVVLLTAGAAATAFALLAGVLARRWQVRAVVVALGVAFVLAAPHLLARPHVLALPVAVAWTALLFGAVDEERDPPWSALALMVLWANLHAGASFGLVLAVAAGLDAVVRARTRGERSRRAVRWGAFVLASLGAASLTPYGPASVLVTVDVLGLGPALAVIPEWRPPDLSSIGPFEVVLLAALGAALVRGVRLPVVRVLVLLGLLHLALTAVRNGDLLGLLAPIVLAAPLAPQLGRHADHVSTADGPATVTADTVAEPPGAAGTAGGRRLPQRRRRSPTAVLTVGGLLTAAAVVVVLQPRPPAVLDPAAALAALDDAGAERLLHEYGFGGSLIAAGVPTFVDGRTELFGGEFVARHAAALSLDDVDGLDGLLVEHDVEGTLLRPSTPAVALLDRSPAWVRVHEDAIAVAHARVADAPPGLGLPPRGP